MKKYKLTPDDRKFLDSLGDGSLTLETWTHESHLRLAWLSLQSEKDFLRALQKVRKVIHAVARLLKIDAINYNESITRTYLQLVQYHQQRLGTETFAQFKTGAPGLWQAHRELLAQYYSPALMKEARRTRAFVAPDLKPLPPVGVIREARLSDAADIRAIYAPYVRDSAFTFELDVPPVSDFRKRIKNYLRYGFWVYEIDGRVRAYAYASSHRERKAYQWCCEISVYTHADFQRCGLAAALYPRLLNELKERGLVNVYAGITLPNAPSVAFHERFGFEKIGVYPRIGYKLGAWHDVGWWALCLNEALENPRDPRI